MSDEFIGGWRGGGKSHLMIQQLEDDQRRMRREALTRQVIHGLLPTLRVLPIEQGSPVEIIEATDKSAEFIAPLVEAVEILESIIWASDGCRGHLGCIHSMEPWQRARKLLEGKWEADVGERRSWP